MKLPDFEYVAPSSLPEAVRLLGSRPGDAKVIAGGQSLLPAMAFRLAQPSLLVDLRNIAGLNEIAVGPSGVVLGARTRWRDIEDSAVLATSHPLLKEAVRHVAHYPVRNRGTVGGSLAHADPAAEMPCVAVTCEAWLRLIGTRGERLVAAGDFFLGPLMNALDDDEIILEARLPHWPAQRRWAFREFALRPGDFALAGVALFFDLDRQQMVANCHIGIFGACQFPHRLGQAEHFLNGKTIDQQVAAAAARIAQTEVDPPSDIHADAEYRRVLVAALVEAALLEAVERVA
jgi:carbon-monoxide dehydrogenase medium subunit